MKNLTAWVKARWENDILQILPEDPDKRHALRLKIFRIIAIVNLILGLSYLIWRYTSTLNLSAWWFAIPLVIAETYSLIDCFLFIFMMWKPLRRVSPVPIEDVPVDVFVTTYNEDIELVEQTTAAACRIDWNDLHVYILDDGARPDMKAAADRLGCGYITRGEEWAGKARHAKAGNVNNALMKTSGEFILILDADQIPAPQIINHTIGYFIDPKVAFVQTPQFFYNLPQGDPFGTDAPLFYGPILQGKDGWDAAFFCGSNAILRREALIQLGITGYVQEVEKQMRRGLDHIEKDLAAIKSDIPEYQAALQLLRKAVVQSRQSLNSGMPLETARSIIQQTLDQVRQVVTGEDINAMVADLRELGIMGDQNADEISQNLIDQFSHGMEQLSQNFSLQSIGLSSEEEQSLALTRDDEAIPIQSLATISITEDMATAMRLHASGWHSIFHSEILAYGLAPEDLGSTLSQRLRWAQGTIQVLLFENPLFKKGLSIPQRIQYFTTMFSYFSGFFNLIYLIAPIVYLFSGIPPVNAWSVEFAWRLIPFLLLNKLMFRYVSWGISVWRGEQYSLALFPLWIQAVVSVVMRVKMVFVVTPKQRQSGNYLPLIWPQLLIAGLTILACVYGIYKLTIGLANPIGIYVNIFWGCYNVWMLSAIIKAAVYKPPENWSPKPPSFLFPNGETTLNKN
ncbi:MAG: glycosyltransferase [Chloroflexota bacterium]